MSDAEAPGPSFPLESGNIKRNLVGRCGYYCGACEIHRAFKDSPRLRIELARKHNCQPGEVRCEGCHALHLGGWSRSDGWGTSCTVLECHHDHGLQFCFQCPEERPCRRWSGMSRRYRKRGMSLRANLDMLRKGRAEEWLAEMDRKWRCQQCGRPIIASPEHEHCHWCGAYQL